MTDEWKPTGHKKHSIFAPDGSLRPPKEGSTFTICHANMLLAHAVAESSLPEDEKTEILRKVDVVYDMGKRIGTKLRDYHRKYVREGGWREGF